jgi:hypothetical protein
MTEKIDVKITDEVPLTDQEVDHILANPETPFEEAVAHRLQLLSDLMMQKTQTEQRMALALAALQQRIVALEQTPKSSIIMPPRGLAS